MPHFRIAAIMPYDIGPGLTVTIGKNCWASRPSLGRALRMADL